MLELYKEEIKKISLISQILEVYVSPKPGLVDKIDSGAHKDMNIKTFIDSSIALNSTFVKCFEIGYLNNEKPPHEILSQLRNIGIKGEKKMFKATKGINTHKGQLFLLGFIVASAGILVSQRETISSEKISKQIKIFTKDIVNKELKTIKGNKLSHGEVIYKKYGKKGIRGEVEEGIPSICNLGYVKFKEYLSNGIGFNNALIGVLIELMAEVDDTNVLWRRGLEGSEYLKKMANKALMLGNVTTQQGMNFILKMNKEFNEKNISPGGCADMLAAVIMIYFLENSKILNSGGNYYGLQQTCFRNAQKI